MRASFLLKPSDRFTARLDARLKLVLCAGVSVAAIIFSSACSLFVLLCGATALALGATSLRTVCFAWLASTLMMLMTTGFSWGLSHFVPGMFSWDILRLSVPYLRMLIAVMLLLSLALSTPVHTVLEKLSSLRLPGLLAIPLSVAIRFIPTFIDDCKQIRDVARLRPRRGLLAVWRGLVVPLVFRMLASADDLAVAAELKGVDPAQKLCAEPAAGFAARDYWIAASALACIGVAIMLQLWGPQTAPLRG